MRWSQKLFDVFRLDGRDRPLPPARVEVELDRAAVVMERRLFAALHRSQVVEEPGRGLGERRPVRLVVVGAVPDVVPLSRQQIPERVLSLLSGQVPSRRLPATEVRRRESTSRLLWSAAGDPRLDVPDRAGLPLYELRGAR